MLIDGGKGQLEAARTAIAAIGVEDVPLVGIAKGRDRDAGRETFFVPGKPPFKLPPRDPTLYFVQRLRDEAHRFAIGTHRAKRKGRWSKTRWMRLPGSALSKARAAPPFRNGESDRTRRIRGSGQDAGRECGDGPRRLRLLSCRRLIRSARMEPSR